MTAAFLALACLGPDPAHAADPAGPAGAYQAASPHLYRHIKGVNPRVAVWLVAQLHLWFAAFVLAVPVFVLVMEAAGVLRKDERYDRLAFEFIRLSTTAYTLTAAFGAVLAAVLFAFYPGLIKYMSRIFSPTFAPYLLLFVVENACLYAYRFGWKTMRQGRAKLVHMGIGGLLNLTGIAIMVIANAWTAFMMSPGGVYQSGLFSGRLWEAINNPLWNPLNLHRFMANIAFGGSIVAAYAAYRFLGAGSDGERAHYDWMGYTANFIAVAALLPLPFAGYWLTAEIYAYSQQMGITLMGGIFGWLFIIQAVLIGALFLSANYYLWCGMERSDGGKRYTPYIKYIAFVIALCFLVWFTPHTPQMRPSEVRAIGGQYHPVLGPLGLMPAKNIAVNIMILFTFLSFLLHRRSNLEATVRWAAFGKAAQAAIFSAAVLNITFLGVYYGYFTNTVYKVASSVPQVVTTILAIAACTAIDAVLFRGAKRTGPVRWGKMPARSQYALVLLAVSFTWLMGLMGFVRSAIRQHWHVYGVVRDTSAHAFTPSITYATRVVSIGTVVFMALMVFIFYLNGRKRDEGLL